MPGDGEGCPIDHPIGYTAVANGNVFYVATQDDLIALLRLPDDNLRGSMRSALNNVIGFEKELHDGRKQIY